MWKQDRARQAKLWGHGEQSRINKKQNKKGEHVSMQTQCKSSKCILLKKKKSNFISFNLISTGRTAFQKDPIFLNVTVPPKGDEVCWPEILYRDIWDEPSTWKRQWVLTDQIHSGPGSLWQSSKLHTQPSSVQTSLPYDTWGWWLSGVNKWIDSISTENISGRGGGVIWTTT